VFAYYDDAEVNPRNRRKITNQQFNNKYVISKIKEIEQYHSSALHWNLNELNTNFHKIIDKVKKAYTKIEIKTGVKLYNVDGLKNFQTKIGEDVSLFMTFSRDKKNTLLPSIGGIKDGLLKMILYSNLTTVVANGNNVESKAVLLLTSSKLKGGITSLSTKQEINNFLIDNHFSESKSQLIETLIQEAKRNQFIVKIQFSK
jgi:hypothetical protein